MLNKFSNCNVNSMCFTPIASLITAIFEFVVSIFLILCFRNSQVSKYFAIFVFMLGFYQLTEYLLCTTLDPFLWAKIGFITYTFLPALAFHFVFVLMNKKFSFWILYILPIFFSIIALLNTHFIITSQCTNMFVLVKSTFFNFSNILLPILYYIYYFGIIIVICYSLIRYYFTKNKKVQKIITLLVLFSIISSLLATIIFIISFPAFSIKFPSVYCWFAFVFSICGIIVCYLDNKYNN